MRSDIQFNRELPVGLSTYRHDGVWRMLITDPDRPDATWVPVSDRMADLLEIAWKAHHDKPAMNVVREFGGDGIDASDGTLRLADEVSTLRARLGEGAACEPFDTGAANRVLAEFGLPEMHNRESRVRAGLAGRVVTLRARLKRRETRDDGTRQP